MLVHSDEAGVIAKVFLVVPFIEFGGDVYTSRELKHYTLDLECQMVRSQISTKQYTYSCCYQGLQRKWEQAKTVGKMLCNAVCAEYKLVNDSLICLSVKVGRLALDWHNQ